MPAGMSEKINDKFDEVTSKYTLNQNKTRALISEEKARLLNEEVYDKESLQMLDVLDSVLLNMTRVSEHKSELTAYRKAANILDIVFNNTEFVMKDGENASIVTKNTRMFNMNLCDDKDDKKNISGRKIDLIMCSSGVELGSSEWKKQDTSSKLIEEQRVKNARVNAAILNNIMSMFVEEKDDEMFIIGMDWFGLVGNMITIRKSKDVTFIHHLCDLIVPLLMHSIPWFKETLGNLYIFKHHLENLEKAIEPERERLDYLRQLNKLRPNKRPSTPPLSEPGVFFTLVTKRTKTNGRISDEDPDRL